MLGILYFCCAIAVLVTRVKAVDLVDCPESGQSFYPHSSSCSQFIECRNGEQSVVECMEGFHFDSELGFCNFPEYVGCTLEDVVEKFVDCPESGQIFYSHPSSCLQFIECNDGEYREIDCIVGLHFNPVLGFCDLPENAGCELEDAIDEDSKENDGSGDGNGDGSENEQSGDGEGGDNEEEGGDQGGGGDDSELVGGEGDSGEGNSDNEVDGEEGNSDNEVDGEEGNSDNAGGPVGACPALNGEFVDFLTDSKDCDVFYKCNWGSPVKFTCPAPLHFNPELNVCDWSENAGCAKG